MFAHQSLKRLEHVFERGADNRDKLVEARESGLSFKEIHERTRAGEYLPAVIPEDIFLPEVW